MADFETPEFQYNPSHHVPFRDKEVIRKARDISREDFLKHPNPHLEVSLMSASEMTFRLVTDMFLRIQEAMRGGEQLVMVIPQPLPAYRQVAHLINRARINCEKLYTFNLDEYANEEDQIAPESWPYGFTHALKKYFYGQIDPDLRPPEGQMVGITNENFEDYAGMISDLGGADVIYTGPGWTGHMAFVEPDAPEVPQDLEEFKQMGPSLVTLSPFTLAQNSLHGSFGASGDLAAVPPKAATVGPAQFLEAKHRVGNYGITVHGTTTSWQRLITRLALFGPVTPRVPDSIIQLKPSEVRVSENIARDITVDWEKGY